MRSKVIALHEHLADKDDLLPNTLAAFAMATAGDYESRFIEVANYAFFEHKILLNSGQLRKLCGGGSHLVAQRAVVHFRDSLHQQFTRRLSASAIAEWIDSGMPQDLNKLSPKERLVAEVFQRYVASLTLRD